jgi:polyhydroxyalkanoate synthesis regulator protein
MNTVKKYENRKLYFDGKYITLLDIIAMLKRGESVTVVSHKDGLDVTNSVLKEALLFLNISTDSLIEMVKKGE